MVENSDEMRQFLDETWPSVVAMVDEKILKYGPPPEPNGVPGLLSSFLFVLARLDRRPPSVSILKQLIEVAQERMVDQPRVN